jgi:hypothetical protein
MALPFVSNVLVMLLVNKPRPVTATMVLVMVTLGMYSVSLKIRFTND